MHIYLVLFTFKLLTFYCVAGSAGLQGVLDVAKCIADTHQELPKSCVFIMKWMENNKVRRNVVILKKKMYSDFESSNAASLIEDTILQ
jgi:hypothetical protein